MKSRTKTTLARVAVSYCALTPKPWPCVSMSVNCAASRAQRSGGERRGT